MSSQAKYKTEPMKLWKKTKEFKANHFKEYHDAHKNGKLRFLGSTALSISMYSGFENAVIWDPSLLRPTLHSGRILE